MTDHQFAKKIAQLIRRAQFLQRVVSGKAKGRDVDVKGHYVRRHFVNAHIRFIENRKS